MKDRIRDRSDSRAIPSEMVACILRARRLASIAALVSQRDRLSVEGPTAPVCHGSVLAK